MTERERGGFGFRIKCLYLFRSSDEKEKRFSKLNNSSWRSYIVNVLFRAALASSILTFMQDVGVKVKVNNNYLFISSFISSLFFFSLSS